MTVATWLTAAILIVGGALFLTGLGRLHSALRQKLAKRLSPQARQLYDGAPPPPRPLWQAFTFNLALIGAMVAVALFSFKGAR